MVSIRTVLQVSVSLPAMLVISEPRMAEGAAAADLGFPGLNCKYYGQQNLDTFLDPTGFGAAGLQNDGSSSKKIACPISKPVSNGIEYVHAKITTSSTVEPKCHIYISVPTDPPNWESYSFGSISGSHTTPSLANYHVDDLPAGIATLYCSVFPAGAVIHQYSVSWLPPGE
jgi:hypothetical protein